LLAPEIISLTNREASSERATFTTLEGKM
jgi:hypothetical protein